MRLAVLALMALGCSTNARFAMSDGTLVRAPLISSSPQSAFVWTDMGPRAIERSEVLTLQHPGFGRRFGGGLLLVVSAFGHLALGAHVAYGCDSCSRSTPLTSVPIALSIASLSSGIAARRESRGRWDEASYAPGSVYRRTGFVLLGLSVASLLGIPAFFAESRLLRGLGVVALGFTPGLSLSALALILRGRNVALSNEGIRFDFSL